MKPTVANGKCNLYAINVTAAITAQPNAHCPSSCVHDRFSVKGMAIVSREVIQPDPFDDSERTRNELVKKVKGNRKDQAGTRNSGPGEYSACVALIAIGLRITIYPANLWRVAGHAESGPRRADHNAGPGALPCRHRRRPTHSES